jgi:hypothetical protein
MGNQDKRDGRRALTGQAYVIGLALVVMGGADVARGEGVVKGTECLGEGAIVDVQLFEVRPARANALDAMYQRGNGLNYSHDYVTLTVKVQLSGEYTDARSGQTRQVNTTGTTLIYFEPDGHGPFQSLVKNVFKSQPLPGWDIESTLVPDTASCRIGVNSSFDRKRGDVVVRPGG